MNILLSLLFVLQPEEVLYWFHELLEGLVFLESQHSVHRDLKLDNLLISERGRVIISDFGKAMLLDETMQIPYTYPGNFRLPCSSLYRYTHNRSLPLPILEVNLTHQICALVLLVERVGQKYIPGPFEKLVLALKAVYGLDWHSLYN